MFVGDYLFNNMGRIGSDKIDESETAVHNVRYGNHVTANYFSDKPLNHPVEFAASQPGVVYNGYAGEGIPGAVIDESSKLISDMLDVRPKQQLEVFQRTYASVPFMGRGPGNADVESRLRVGKSVFIPKGEGTVTSMSFSDVAIRPLEKGAEERVKDPSNMVEELALPGWVRGGANTRENAGNRK